MHKQVKTLVFSNVLKLGVTHIWASVFITISLQFHTAKLEGVGEGACFL